MPADTAITKIQEVIDFLRKEAEIDPDRAGYFRIWANGMVNAKKILERVSDDSPQWHDRPTVPGKWFGVSPSGKSVVFEEINVEEAAAELIAGIGWRWFGPIPEAPDTTARSDAGHN